jgi:hypothetical protein
MAWQSAEGLNLQLSKSKRGAVAVFGAGASRDSRTVCISLIFAPTKFFSFFSWGEIRRISPHLARASRMLVASSCVAVGRNGRNFAPGVGQNSLRVGRNERRARSEEHGANSGGRAAMRTGSREPAKMRKTPPRGFAHLRVMRPWQVCPATPVRRAQVRIILGCGFCAAVAIWIHEISISPFDKVRAASGQAGLRQAQDKRPFGKLRTSGAQPQRRLESQVKSQTRRQCAYSLP